MLHRTIVFKTPRNRLDHSALALGLGLGPGARRDVGLQLRLELSLPANQRRVASGDVAIGQAHKQQVVVGVACHVSSMGLVTRFQEGFHL